MNLKIVLSISCIALVTTVFGQQSKPWPVPAKYQSMKNPGTADLTEGKALWSKHCQSCHGKTGKGDGPKAEQLKTQPEDLGSATVQKQPDGVLFFKTYEGRDDMPAFKKKISDEEDIWNVVNYIRTFKK